VSIYATIADLRARVAEDELIQLTDDARTGSIDVAAVTRALDQAANIIDGYVAATYKRIDATVPVPPLLIDIACDIARYRLYRHGSPTEHADNNYKTALSQLKQIQAGTIKLDLGEEVLVSRDDMIIVQSSERMMTRDQLSGY
jgi:phage gp36-like protein